MRPEAPVEDEVPLGLEAVDMSVVEEAARRNQALDRTNGFRAGPQNRFTSFAQNADARAVVSLGEDESYARRFYSAFLTRKDKKQ